jgi:peroxin-5
VSYVNELDSAKALRNLKAWVQHNPRYNHGNLDARSRGFFLVLMVFVWSLRYHGLEVDPQDAYGDGSLMDEVMELMQAAAAHGDAATDPDVQVVLGVLYNVSRDFGAAADAFEAAAAAAPADHSLWNKLGATRANSSRSEEALGAYHTALKIKPR